MLPWGAVQRVGSAIRGVADMETAYRLCLWSRLANRVLLVLKRFPMKNAEDLYNGVLDVDWHDHMVSDGTLAVEFSGHGSGIDNTHFGALKVKDAIVDKLRTMAWPMPCPAPVTKATLLSNFIRNLRVCELLPVQ